MHSINLTTNENPITISLSSKGRGKKGGNTKNNSTFSPI